MTKIVAVKVLPNVWLGDKSAAKNKSFFKKMKISAVLNMTPNVCCHFQNVQYLQIPVHDSMKKRDTEKMLEYFPIATEFIYQTSVVEKQNILVHCSLGRQRSASAIVAYLIKYYKMTPYNGMQFILNQKVDTFHWGQSVNFAKSLNKWHNRCQNERIISW